MSRASKKRLREGALSALRTPENAPVPARLVPIPDPLLVRKAIARAKEGDSEGLHFLYVRYAADVQRYVSSFVRDDHEAEDITQNVFAKLMASIKHYEPGEVPFEAWIMRVARNAALDHMRARREPADDDVSAESSRALRNVLEQLPEDQREVLILRHIAGLSPVEIATTLKKSESSVHGLHHRGRRALQARLAELDARQHALEKLLQE